MGAKSISIAVAEEDLPLLDELVERCGGGNRSEFLRYAMKRLKHDSWSEKMRGLQARTRAELGGRVYSAEEVAALIRENREAHA